MSLTLGQKLRQAREERGFSISEVAEQTRISSLYLECIENDDYRTLPGGIFNKGFVKSFSKFVGVDEQEALADYAAMQSAADIASEQNLKLYKPEVLTDDSSGSMLPTIIVAALILGLMTVGILYGVSYLRAPSEPVAANTAPKTNTNTATGSNSNTSTEQPAGDIPDMATLKVEFKAVNQPVRLAAISDGTKSDNVVAAGSAATFEPKESLTLNYNRWNASAVQLTINGRSIALPAEPLNPKDKRIEFTISRENLAQIWTTGSITGAPAAPAPAPDANTAGQPADPGTTPTAATPTAPVTPTPPPATPKPPTTNTAPPKTPDPKPAAPQKPPTTTTTPPANGM